MTLSSTTLARGAGRILAGLRLLIGVVAFAAPTRLARGWVGVEAADGTGKVLARAMGGRDLALGLGAVLALGGEGAARGWLEAGGLADAGDVVASVLAWRRLPHRGRWVVLALAGGGVIASAALARLVDGA
jgi:hypothetical protein